MTGMETQGIRADIVKLAQEFERAVDENNEIFAEIETIARDTIGPDDFEDVDDLRTAISDLDAALVRIHDKAREAQR